MLYMPCPYSGKSPRDAKAIHPHDSYEACQRTQQTHPLNTRSALSCPPGAHGPCLSRTARAGVSATPRSLRDRQPTCMSVLHRQHVSQHVCLPSLIARTGNCVPALLPASCISALPAILPTLPQCPRHQCRSRLPRLQQPQGRPPLVRPVHLLAVTVPSRWVAC